GPADLRWGRRALTRGERCGLRLFAWQESGPEVRMVENPVRLAQRLLQGLDFERRLGLGARPLGQRNLRHQAAEEVRLGDDLRGDERALGWDRDAGEYRPPKELERAVHVLEADAEDPAGEPEVGEGAPAAAVACRRATPVTRNQVDLVDL